MNPSVEESLSISEELPTSTKSLFDALRVPPLSDLTRRGLSTAIPRLRVNVEHVVRDRVNPRVSLLYSG